jgi:endonuclease/exonuclease/phosphatase (EEP) superfamily protein YafD
MAMLASCAGDQVPAPAKDGEAKLRVMTYNVNFGVAGDKAGIEAIASVSPDLVLLQETNEVWEQALVSALGVRYRHHRFAPPHDEWIAGGMGVLSRWPIAKVDTLFTQHGPFFAWRIVVDAPGGAIQILNVHLRPPMSDGGSWVVGYFSTRGVREREALDHVTSLDPTLPTLVTGDFNEEDDGKAIAVFAKRGLQNALPQFHPNKDTWQWPVSGGITLRFRLDHILYGPELRAVAAGVVDAGRSDHAPVWADFVRR